MLNGGKQMEKLKNEIIDRKEKGITLLSLVVTIIVLLILVSIGKPIKLFKEEING